ncbi:MAG: response regulator [Candidatus Delongbacteria bacterium]|nr:response regulator [Candidatus Delongbacteria bacterium]
MDQKHIRTKVLIVEDDFIAAEDLKQTLEHLGYQVIDTVSEAQQVFKSLENHIPQIILMDIKLTGETDGITTAAYIRRIMDVPIIFITGHDDDETLQRAKVTNPFGFLLKPYGTRELKSTLEMALYQFETEKALRDRDERFRFIMDHIPATVYTTDQNLIITSFYGRFAHHPKLINTQIIGLNIVDFVNTWSSNPIVGEYHQRTLKGERPRIEFYFLESWLELRLEPMMDSRRQISGIIGLAYDITDRKKNEIIKESVYRIQDLANQARSMNELFQELYQVIKDLIPVDNMYIALYNENKQILSFPFFIDLFNPLPPDRPFNRGLTEYIIRRNQPLLLNQSEIMELIHQGEISILSEILPSCWMGTLLTRSDYTIEGVIALQSYPPDLGFTRQDLNVLTFLSSQIAMAIERKITAESLQTEKEQLAVTLRSIGDGVITTDTSGTIILFNKKAEEITGWNGSDAVGRSISEVFRIFNPETEEPAPNPIEQAIRQRAIVGLMTGTILQTRDHTMKIIADSCAPIFDKNSDIIGVVLIFRDVTDKIKMEHDLINKQKIESIGILAGGIAHDFNNILTIITGNLSLMMYQYSGSHQDQNYSILTNIEKATAQARELTTQLLTFAKGGIPIKKLIPIEELIRNSVGFALRGTNVLCHYYFDPNLKPVEVDPGQIGQVIQNIVINAEQAMPNGGIIRIKASNTGLLHDRHPSLPEGDYIQISISDSGIGIPKEYLKKIFDPYFTTKQKGSGLGLAITFSIIQKHGGLIEVSSESGKGTTFTLYLPASGKSLPAEVKTESVLKTGKARILVLDDEEMIRDLIQTLLHHLGYEVTLSQTGEETVKYYQEAVDNRHPYDLLIMDLTIPGGMGGKETIQHLKQINPRVKAIVSSGYSNDPILSNYRDYGFCGVIVKPYHLKELSDVVSQVAAMDSLET